MEQSPRERGRPARTILPAASAISSTRVDRQGRQGSASAGPLRFPPAGWSAAASQGNRTAGRRAGLRGLALSALCCRRLRGSTWATPLQWPVPGIARPAPGSRPRLPAAAAPRLNGSPGRSPGDYQLLTSVAPALSCGSYESETIGNRPFLRDLGIPSRLTSTP